MEYSRRTRIRIGFSSAALLLFGAGCLPAPDYVSAVRLDLSGRGLTSVPAEIFNEVGLEELDVSDNRLTGALPAEIRRLRNLRVLDASGNRMTGVPAEIGQLDALRVLDLSDNKLTGLPLELGNLRNLERLDLRGNAVSAQDLDAIRARLPNADIRQ